MIELLVAILIAGVAFGALVPLFIQMQKTSNADKLRSVALQVSQDRIEKIRQLKYELITVDNLKSSTFNAGQFGTTWSETGESGSKRNYAITYKVEEKSPSADARSVYKVVTVSTEWVGAPTPHKAAVLTTMVYPQSAGPRVADFFVSGSAGASRMLNADPSSISSLGTPIVIQQKGKSVEALTLKATVSADSAASMKQTVGGVTQKGWIEFAISGGGTSSKVTVACDGSTAATYSWSPPADLGASDGYYTFKATAFSAAGAPGDSWPITYRREVGSPSPPTNLQGTYFRTTNPGESKAYLTWTTSASGDVVEYRVYKQQKGKDAERFSVPAPKASGNMGYTLVVAQSDIIPVSYKVVAVDWSGNESSPTNQLTFSASVTAKTPAPASGLSGSTSGGVARLRWVPATNLTNLLGYVVYQAKIDSSGAVIAKSLKPVAVTTATSCDVPQDWKVTGGVQACAYQVKPFGPGCALADYTKIDLSSSPALCTIGGVNWLQLSCEDKWVYELAIRAMVPLESLTLFSVNAGTETLCETSTPSAGSAALLEGESLFWSGLEMGLYKYKWQATGGEVVREKSGLLPSMRDESAP